MKQLLPSKMVEAEDSVRYSSSEVGRLAGRGAVPRIHAEPAGVCVCVCASGIAQLYVCVCVCE